MRPIAPILFILSIHVNSPVVFPHTPSIWLGVGMWQMQDHPGAPGTARQESTRTIVSTYDGGTATQPRAPGHERPLAASSDVAGHDRPCATPRAPGADAPPATTAGAPGQYRLRAVPPAPDPDRSAARHTMAPGHDRPLAALSAVRHDRPCATPRAPGADVPLAIPAGVPGQHRLRAAQRAHDHFRSRPAPMAPGHGRPLAASSDVVGHDRPRATLTAPGADVPPATTAGAPGQHRPSAVANATVALPAGQHRLRQERLPRTPATPNTHTYPHIHQETAHNHAEYSQNHLSPCTAGGLQGGQIMSPASSSRLAPQSSIRSHPPLSTMWRGAGGEVISSPTTHQVHPAIQVPPQPRSCSTAAASGLHQHPSRAPPTEN